jgi:hypothetical protein
VKIYWTKTCLPGPSDANAQGQVLATNSGYHGMRAVPFQEVTPDKFGEWAPLLGPVEGTQYDPQFHSESGRTP